MQFSNYHFHIFFSENQLDKVNRIVQELSKLDFISIGRIWNKPIGPHPVGSCQITVSREYFFKMAEWFLHYRDGLSIFIHALSGDDYKDHTDYVLWIGQSYEVKADIFKKA